MVRIFSSDLEKLELRLQSLLLRLANLKIKQTFYLFVLILDNLDRLNSSETLVQEYCQNSEHSFVLNDLSLTKLYNSFNLLIAVQIAAFS
jgi:hypothetical protein